MSRKVFYSFHYERDAWRAANVRNSNVIADEDEYGVIDAVEWEKIEREGEEAIKRWINEQFKYTSVTVVLVGAETADRPWVNYEIRRSWERGNGIVAVRIHNIKDSDQKTDSPGKNPLENFELNDGTRLSQICKIYDWVEHDGRENIGTWVEQAFQDRANYQGEQNLKGEAVTKDFPSTMYSTGPTVINNPTRPWAQ